MNEMPEHVARHIFETAIREGRAGELLMELFEGAGVTVDRLTGRLVILPASALAQFTEGGDDG